MALLASKSLMWVAIDLVWFNLNLTDILKDLDPCLTVDLEYAFAHLSNRFIWEDFVGLDTQT